MNVNLAVVVGNITDVPELTTLDSGTVKGRFTIAVNRKWKDKNGETKEEASFIPVTVWGPSAENCAKYLVKGQQVAVRGRLHPYSYEKDGEKKYGFDVVADDVQFGSKPRGNGSTSDEAASEEGAPF